MRREKKDVVRNEPLPPNDNRFFHNNNHIWTDVRMAINIHSYKKYKCTGIDIFVNDLNIVPYPFTKKFPLIKVYKIS